MVNTERRALVRARRLCHGVREDLFRRAVLGSGPTWRAQAHRREPARVQTERLLHGIVFGVTIPGVIEGRPLLRR